MLARLLGGQSLGPEDPEGADAGGLRGRADSEGFQSSVCDSHVTGSTANKKSLVNSAFTAPTAYRNSGSFVHGTKFKNFKSIMEQGLKVVNSEIFMIDEIRSDGRVPGLKDRPEILIFIDEQKARSHHIDFDYDAKEGSWRTKGQNGVIRPWFFQKVVDQRKGRGRVNVLFQSKHDPVMFANVLGGSRRPAELIHGTTWENYAGIMREGLVPAKNPTSELRRPFRELLQGAEHHVYAVKATSTADAGADHARSQSSSEDYRQLDSGDPCSPQYELTSQRCGLDQPPDTYFIIDTQKAQEMGVQLNIVQSPDSDETVYVQGPVPKEVLRPRPNYPVDLPENLRATIVDPESFEQIPIIDISGDEHTVVEQMRYACQVVGFMQVTGHAVPTELQERCAELQRRFFALPSSVKERLALSEESPVRGYFGVGGEDLDRVLNEEVDKADGQKVQKQSRKDKKESLDTNGVPWSIPSGGSVARMFGQPSVLPEEDELPGFRAALEEYAAEMFRLSKKLLSIMARVLGHPADFFDQYLTAPVATHRLLHYWPLEDFQTEIGVGEHTDYGLLTVLAQDTVGGLQVLNAKDGRWVHCVPIPNAFVVNLGDMLARWTNHKFKSTIHRVVTISRKERYSVPFFLEPNMDAQIALGGILPAGEAPAAPGDTAEDILERFYRASGQLKPRGAAGAPAPPRESEAGAGAAHGQPSFEPPPRVSSQ